MGRGSRIILTTYKSKCLRFGMAMQTQQFQKESDFGRALFIFLILEWLKECLNHYRIIFKLQDQIAYSNQGVGGRSISSTLCVEFCFLSVFNKDILLLWKLQQYIGCILCVSNFLLHIWLKMTNVFDGQHRGFHFVRPSYSYKVSEVMGHSTLHCLRLHIQT